MTQEQARRRAVQAAKRFGYGPSSEGLSKAFVEDPQAALLSELRQGLQPLPGRPLGSSRELYRQKRDWERLREARAAGRPVPADLAGREVLQPEAPQHQNELRARARAIAAAGTGINERLAWFWSNHLCVSAMKNGWVSVLSGAYEREAIRPHLGGRFEEMVLASARHPAMLTYLDNRSSIGPQSPEGRKRGRGLNENYARELLELHTLGVDGGYSQRDVLMLARALTGWTYDEEGVFRFALERHEPGAKIILGQVIAAGGESEGEAAIRAACRRPAAARFIATKMARHFVNDTPRPELIAHLERAFRDSDGDLSVLHEALLTAPDSWREFGAKVLTPQEFVFTSTRALGFDPHGVDLTRWLRALGQDAWNSAAPDGYPDTRTAWLTPAGIQARIDTAYQISGHTDVRVRDPRALCAAVLDALATPQTVATVRGAPTVRDGLVLLLSAPEFHRR
ncbi:DUF1800 domain-containing protein [Phenylobacterium sp. J426]|uniref:DUF1800 domain-containing protein n=1 Tax=Phenylobacterium sp. J426 TaxID=2898439 RepID=UPI00215147E5|nr:DUF1800 domain-containing protein [Phenylobacterium sp. J426]MCR5876567.1 DUF1800 domain-containing protein [Phenylobacterium sp. J426]